MKKYHLLLFFSIVVLCTGCSVQYNLDIDKNGFKERIFIFSSSELENNLFSNKPYTVYSDVGENNINPDIKESDKLYYSCSLKTVNGLKKISYMHLFPTSEFKRSRAVSLSYDTFIFRQYDHDMNGKNDYMLLSTTDSFSWFNIYDNLDEVTINIHCRYKIISSNADVVDGNIHTWYLKRDKLKAINMVYNPEVYVDDRSLWEKIMDGDYVNMFTIFLMLLLICGFIYIFIKFKGNRHNNV